MKTRILKNFVITAISLGLPSLASAATAPSSPTIYPASVCPNVGWSHAELDALPDQILAISKAVQSNYLDHKHDYPKEIDIKPLINEHLLSQDCAPIKNISKARIQITGSHQSTNHKDSYEAFMIKAHNMSEKACHILVLSKKMQGLLGYFSDISVNGQPVILGSDDSFYQCNRFGKNDFSFVSRF